MMASRFKNKNKIRLALSLRRVEHANKQQHNVGTNWFAEY